MSIISKPEFPNVPSLPGVPQLLRSVNFPAAPPPQLNAAIAAINLVRLFTTKPKWAVYKHEKPSVAATPDGLDEVVVIAKRTAVVVPDSFLTFGYRNEYEVSDYPVQEGAFASYNKVANPFESTVRMTKGGSVQDRQNFLKQIEDIIGSLDTYDIVTPERTYLNVNPIRFELNREGAQGAYFFAEADLYFREIREVTATYTTTSLVTQNAKNFSAKPVTNLGTVYGLTPSASVVPPALF